MNKNFVRSNTSPAIINRKAEEEYRVILAERQRKKEMDQLLAEVRSLRKEVNEIRAEIKELKGG